MDWKELQEEELEVLASIYDGDENFKQISSSCFQYKIGEDAESRSFLLEIFWLENYPYVPPKLSLDAFFNKKLLSEVKTSIIEKLCIEAENQLGTPMTYTLIEWAKDNAEELTKDQPEKLISPESTSSLEEKITQDDLANSSSKKDKKPKQQLTKQQKRKLADKMDSKGERPRGWDWVDVVKHLSQLGSKHALTDDAS